MASETDLPIDVNGIRSMIHSGLRSYKLTHTGQALLAEARRAAGSQSIEDLLYDLYTRLIPPTTLYSNKEAAFLILLLHSIADGQDVARALRIDHVKVGHRRKTQLPAVVLDAVHSLLRIGLHKTKTSAMQEVADVLEMELGAVKEAYRTAKKREDERNAVAKRASKKS
jgi:hypothetical protein